MAVGGVRSSGGGARARALLACAGAAAVLAACASHGPSRPAGGGYKVGAPYQAGGLWYVPKEDPHYDEVGIASWYGSEFNGRPTANGERFDMDAVSAAHATLPMPSIVEVTNLENGRSIKVRVNDRGPFARGRIIDLSHAGAMALGYAARGVARVRVRYVGPAPLGEEAPRTYQARYREPEPPPAAQAARYVPLGDGPGFAVQAGAFADKDNAERMARRLKKAGKAEIRPLDRSDGLRLYRVVIGPWDREDDAWSMLARVAGLGVREALVVRF